jgi:hypothetical protein
MDGFRGCVLICFHVFTAKIIQGLIYYKYIRDPPRDA